ncbi:SDR family NAD(P)-dependent oxidoreductase [Pedobacter sp. GR22-10]|uniref:SDR family NAD(P)-dependent oxidoreductase n=1 Tax=Pedobacter sp. GR22-10 TaxID=2994472 RepID=UPI002248548B|nr:SDR family oxidoreductase [Pedobacter sp. GR22-10]MCX2430591.1 SDR family oxidoreductase [Pedobacter sp. GR22-10]
MTVYFKKSMKEQKKVYAIITGASKGIGRSIATELAKKGFNLLLVARSAEELASLGHDLEIQYGIATDFLAIDLSIPTSPKVVSDWITDKNYGINALVNNAGYGQWGQFKDLDLQAQMEMCRLNMDTLVSLCHLLIPSLIKEKQSYILNISSTAAYQAVPTLAIYSATKAFVLSFSRALRFELKNTSISVTCLSPGPVDTGFAHRAGLDAFSKMAEKFNMQPDEVARIAIKGMLAKKSEIVPGLTNMVSVYANRFLPKAFIEKMAAGIYKV